MSLRTPFPRRFLGSGEQPAPHRLHYGPQPLIADSLPVLAGHTAVNVSHDGIDRDLIPAFSRVGLEIVTERIKPKPATTVDLELAKELAELMGNGVDRD